MTLCYTHRQKDPFVRFDKKIVMDSTISWKAKGLLTYAFSRPGDWKFYKKEMMGHAKDGEASFDSGIKELETAGYLHRLNKHEAKTGQFEGLEWHFFETPISIEEFNKRYRKGGFSGSGESPVPVKPSPTKKEEKSKNDQNNKQESFVVPQSLDDLELSHKFKQWVIETYQPDQIQQALQAMYPGIRNVECWLRTALNEQYIVQDSDDNKTWAAAQIKTLQTKFPDKIELNRQFLDFWTGKQFDYDDKDFRDKVIEYLDRVGGFLELQKA